MNKITVLTLLLLMSTMSFLWSIDLPTSFDLRQINNKSYVTSVKEQQGGTCWTHGAMAAMESNLLMTGAWKSAGDSGEPNLAEYHLDWWTGFNEYNNDDIDPPWGSGLSVHYGGDYRITAAYLARGEGAVRELDGQSFNYAPLRDSPHYHHYYARDIEWYVLGTEFQNMSLIKQQLMSHGALGTCMLYRKDFILDFIHYQPVSTSDDPNHAIAIVGWDDTLTTTADQPGAWICKNSWGEGWGDSGFFWISYYDKHCAQHPEMGAISFQHVELMKYNHVYYHDYHGWRDTIGDIEGAFNVFQAVEMAYLKAVSFFTASDSVFFTMKIFNDFKNGELIAELAHKSGFIDHTGFHTIDLDSNIVLTKDDLFYLYVALSNGGQPIDRTSEVPVLLGTDLVGTIVLSTAQPNESYYRDEMVWKDLHGYKFTNSEWDGTANFCIKGLTIEMSPSDSNWNNGDLPEDYRLRQNYPNPFNSSTIISFELPTTSVVTIKIYDLLGREVKTLIDRLEDSGIKYAEWDGTDKLGHPVSSGVYIYRMRTGSYVFSKKMMLLR